MSDHLTNAWKPLDREADYTYASYYYARDPDLINTVPAQAISVVKDKDGRELDMPSRWSRATSQVFRIGPPRPRPAGSSSSSPSPPRASEGRKFNPARRHAIDNTIARHDTGDMATRAAGKANLRCVYWAYAGPPHCPAG